MKDSYTTGHNHIDEHHEHLLNLTTQLDSVIQSNRRKNIEPIIEFLEDYSKNHFKESKNNYRGEGYKCY